MKKYGQPILVGLLIGGVLSVGYIVWVNGRTVITPVSQQQAVSGTPIPVKLLTWNDPNGFSFQYPEGLVINKHDEDRKTMHISSLRIRLTRGMSSCGGKTRPRECPIRQAG